MAHVWKQALATNGEPQWTLEVLDGEAAVPLFASGRGGGRGAAALLLRSRTEEGDLWLLMSAAPCGVALNGVPLRTGIRVLAHRDEIRIAGSRAFFSTERLAKVEVFAGAARRIDCPRCKLEVVAGSRVVICPLCARVFHQDAALELLCFTEGERCVCPQPTALDDASYQWTPEGL